MQDISNYSLAIFDLGNVVFRIDWQPMFNQWSELSGKKIEELKQNFEKFSNHQDANLFSKGLISGQEFCTSLNKELGLQLCYDEFISSWNSIFGEIFTETEDFLKFLKSKLKIVALTNNNQVHALVWKNLYKEVLTKFDQVYVSSEIGMNKPDREIFTYVLEESGVIPEASIFFDDTEANVLAARKLGIYSVLVDPQNIRNSFDIFTSHQSSISKA